VAVAMGEDVVGWAKEWEGRRARRGVQAYSRGVPRGGQSATCGMRGAWGARGEW
jgi:hypothetical protein